MSAKPVTSTVRTELAEAMNSPFTFAEFEYCRRHLAAGKIPGPSGLTTLEAGNGQVGIRVIQHHVMLHSGGKTGTLLPKEPGTHDLSKIRPISLFEVIRKMCVGMTSTRVQRVWHAHKCVWRWLDINCGEYISFCNI